MKQLMPCLRMRSTFSFIFSFSAISISATLAVESTRTLEPKICGTHTYTHVTGVASVLALSAGAMPYLDLVRVHAGVGDEDVGVLDPLGLVHSDPLVQQEACEGQEEQSHDHYATRVPPSDWLSHTPLTNLTTFTDQFEHLLLMTLYKHIII